MLPPVSEPKPHTRAQIEARIWALELDIACLQRDPVKYARGIAILRACIDVYAACMELEVRDERV